MRGTQVLVGRRPALDAIRDAIGDASRGQGGLVLVSGEAGIGKTRLAEEAGRIASEAGLELSWATCWAAGGAPAFWPWIQLLRQQAERREPDELRRALGPAGAIRNLVPQLPGRMPVPAWVAPLPSLDAREERFRFFDEVTSFFRRLAASRPLLLVIDDLHEADLASALLLSFLVSGLRTSGMLVVATYREPEAESAPLASVLGEILKTANPVELGRLDESEVAELLADVGGALPEEGMIRAVFERSGGNPLFVRELGRLLLAQGRLADPRSGTSAIPRTLLPVIEQRTRLLSTECRTVLEAGAVAGQDFPVDLMGLLTGFPQDTVTGAIEEALRAGIVVPYTGRPGTLCFVHGLIRDVVYRSIPPASRSELHRLVADRMELSPERDRYLSELAQHYASAGSPDDLSRALDHREGAATKALGVLAYEDAIKQAEQALDLLDLVEPADDARRLRLLLVLASAQHSAARVGDARNTYLRAADAARTCGDALGLAMAAIGYGSSHQYGGGVSVDERIVALAEEALAALPAAHDELRARLMTQIAFEVVYSDPARFRELGQEVIDAARRLTDPHTRTNALQLRHQMLFDDVDHVPERLAVATELLRLGTEHRHTEALAYGRIWRVYNLLMLGDIDGVDAEIAAMERLIEDARMAAYRWFPALWRAMRRLLEGRIDEAEVLAVQALEAGEARGQGAVDHLGMQLIAIRREQGRLDELVPLIRDAAERYPEIPSYRCALAMAYAESGQEAAARGEFERLASDGFATVPRDYSWTICLLLLSETCALLSDADRAAVLYDLFLPFDRRFVIVGYAGLCAGAVSHQLGILAATAGRTADAKRHLEAALREHRAVGAAAWIVRTQYELGRLLAATDRARSQELLGTAHATALELGLASMSARIEAAMSGEAARAEPASEHVFRRDGDLWTLSFDGRTVHMKDAKGLGDLSRLLANPGREVHALHLVAGEATVRPTPADEVLDERAVDSYRARIGELREEIEEAEADNDAVRAERARAELDTLTSELASAYGLGGRKRRPGDPAERARKAVTERIRDSLRRIAGVHPELGRHLERSVNTGTFCSYTPDRPIRWTT